MHFSLLALPFAAQVFAAALATPEKPGNIAERDAAKGEIESRDSGFQINYYTDGGCSSYLTSVFPSTDGSCYGYSYNGDNSANIANCDAPGGYTCYCTFYAQSGCQGASQTVAYNSGNCASNYGHGFLSMECFYLFS
ncbi:hypothetical protein F4813DRAFT_389261 [Daldinia decipiens]|uniref:uncharacterized protein n=1 Tax=Daldinia decipiens TaxID=326647 RepID=UPI0020C3A399|nr:uncharacterized protein F4813DRAFT_389261 [Daldinia decipiens]KAI1657997.1 hypothetical protein F4813DRAFT_389261 [Daldinia decipiens]